MEGDINRLKEALRKERELRAKYEKQASGLQELNMSPDEIRTLQGMLEQTRAEKLESEKRIQQELEQTKKRAEQLTAEIQEQKTREQALQLFIEQNGRTDRSALGATCFDQLYPAFRQRLKTKEDGSLVALSPGGEEVSPEDLMKAFASDPVFSANFKPKTATGSGITSGDVDRTPGNNRPSFEDFVKTLR